MNDSDDFGLLLIVAIWFLFLLACVWAVVTTPDRGWVSPLSPDAAVPFEETP